MILTKNDLLKDISFNYNKFIGTQDLISTMNDYTLLGEINSSDISDFYKEVLKLNDYLKVTGNTKYKLHKSYPSPRSIYPFSIFLAIDGVYIKKDEFSDKYLVYKGINEKSDSIVIEFSDKYPEFYKSIKKTLLLLELGHLLYNIGVISQAYGVSWEVDFNSSNLVLKLKSNNVLKKHLNLNDFYRKIDLRSSGPFTNVYLGNKIETKHINYSLEDSLSIIKNIYGIHNIFNFIDMHIYINENSTEYKSKKSGNSISYQKLNQIYPYLNFRNNDAFIIFTIKNNYIVEEKLSFLYSGIGIISQNIILNNCCNNKFTRPIKSINLPLIDEILCLDPSKETPVFGVIISNY
ncbi:hypothetical protein AJ85_21650 [Alkalihalobacillus alcalophilus ATCC 27647 = CGMCC 1.3604]|uniref:Nitroreductase domain-containing protein n=1 Tax=Alkalihalobacillus alcalophilus ATCC 27647 = CGMCC 1.3604 TaxID=1218173 RepID=A0A094YT09_ALKAL|nr:hypothetical protein [Alkalihalobacillus alcalophilus]KGA96622.1 hypothetical protein BALCAV_0214970 [Alkalihalobacillus alcalophilus ATCC 27647 = CGMCC 1.3604]MED1563610.1 hypothetical protein [Alkalihalobacillus alcalophilus]THG91994.1 hypothetical protein AJ85_21650 [Alkalihalobacillus alcalophilus ATCC 27647 = CGMCC 1.3604]